ncbi:hypothetical protein J3R74_000369 [Puniceicoccus vermicola]
MGFDQEYELLGSLILAESESGWGGFGCLIFWL